MFGESREKVASPIKKAPSHRLRHAHCTTHTRIHTHTHKWDTHTYTHKQSLNILYQYGLRPPHLTWMDTSMTGCVEGGGQPAGRVEFWFQVVVLCFWVCFWGMGPRLWILCSRRLSKACSSGWGALYYFRRQQCYWQYYINLLTSHLYILKKAPTSY